MDDFQDLYRELILDHYRNPRNHGTASPPDIDVEGVNPVCGDQLRLTLKVEDRKIRDIRFEGKGCSISQSSASMMTEALKEKTVPEAQDLIKQFKDMMLGTGSADNLPEDLEDLAALEGVKKYPVRIKCALLAWNTLLEGFMSFATAKSPVAAKHQEK